MYSFYYILIILTIYRVVGLYNNNRCDVNTGEIKMVNCEKSSVCKEEFTRKPSASCLPWQYFDKDNKTWQEMDSNSSSLCKPISCIPDKHKYICDIPSKYISKFSTIDIKLNWKYFKINILLFVLINESCAIGSLCENCSLVDNMIRNRFAECETLQVTKYYDKITINNLKDDQTAEIYLIPVIDEASIGSVGRFFVKTQKQIAVPKNLTVQIVTSNEMTLQWEIGSKVEEYCLNINFTHFYYFEFGKNYANLYNLKPCETYCFSIGTINSRRLSGMSETKCVIMKPSFRKIELLPIKSDLLSYKLIHWKYHFSNDNCDIKFVVEYGVNQTIFRANTTLNFVNLTNLEMNQLYTLKVFPVSGNEIGPHFEKKHFLTMKTNDIVKDYIQTDEIMRNSIENSWMYEIENSITNTKNYFFNFPLFIEESINNPMKEIKENFEKKSKKTKISFQRNKNQIKIMMDIMANDNGKTIEFILALMNQPNRCILIADCEKCNNISRKRTINTVRKAVGIEFCKLDKKLKELHHKKENSDLITEIKINEEVVYIYSINSLDKKTVSFELAWLLGLVMILLLLILIFFADKKGLISIDEIMNVMSDRNRFRNYMRECFTGKPVQQNIIPRNNDNIVMKRPISTSIKIRNSEIIDPNHPHFQMILEYAKICKQALNREKLNFTFKTANLPENLRKNRFKNILPFDQTRVILQSRNSGTDYINASLISFSEDPNVTEYIAAQGPLANTITDFWYMIWEQNVSVIVMLTKVYEGLNLKCEQYWPLSIGCEYLFDENLALFVVMEEEIFHNSFVERIFKLTNNDLNQTRIITQIHMHKWNDFSKPKKHNFEECITRFHEITSSKNPAPYLIHCSAGVGRTGTFIAIDRLIKKQLRENLNVKIKDVVLELRIFRHNMVQQDSQYIFINEFMEFFSRKFKMQSVYCQTGEVSEEISTNLM